jgi:hypothetical protein
MSQFVVHVNKCHSKDMGEKEKTQSFFTQHTPAPQNRERDVKAFIRSPLTIMSGKILKLTRMGESRNPGFSKHSGPKVAPG